MFLLLVFGSPNPRHCRLTNGDKFKIKQFNEVNICEQKMAK